MIDHETLRLMSELKMPLDKIAHMRRAAEAAINEAFENALLAERVKEEGPITIKGEIIAGPQGQPDKPGTVRAPGVRRQPGGKTRWNVWSNQ